MVGVTVEGWQHGVVHLGVNGLSLRGCGWLADCDSWWRCLGGITAQVGEVGSKSQSLGAAV